jgi:hypothetical protein
MTLGELIAALAAAPAGKAVAHGFGNPHSYRGYYDEVAFEPARNITVGDMLAAARSALGATFQGWKGGDYVMKEYTDCWLATEGDCGETIGPVLLRLMLAAPDPDERWQALQDYLTAQMAECERHAGNASQSMQESEGSVAENWLVAYTASASAAAAHHSALAKMTELEGQQ